MQDNFATNYNYTISSSTSIIDYKMANKCNLINYSESKWTSEKLQLYPVIRTITMKANSEQEDEDYLFMKL